MLNTVESAQEHLSCAYAWIDEQVTSDDFEVAPWAAAVALDLYAAAAELASVTGRVELIPDAPCTNAESAAEHLRRAGDLLAAADASQLAAAARRIGEAHDRLTSTGVR